VKQKVKSDYYKLLLKLLAIYALWIVIAVLCARMISLFAEDPAYLELGRSLWYFLPILVFETGRQVAFNLQLRHIKNDDFFVKKIQSRWIFLQKGRSFQQVIFLLLLISTIATALIYRSTVAVLLAGVTIQWFVLIVLWLSEAFYSENTIREMRDTDEETNEKAESNIDGEDNGDESNKDH
jgi:hypothetical protein